MGIENEDCEICGRSAETYEDGGHYMCNNCSALHICSCGNFIPADTESLNCSQTLYCSDCEIVCSGKICKQCFYCEECCSCKPEIDAVEEALKAVKLVETANVVKANKDE